MNGTAEVIGAIDNADVMLASITIASFALLLPASRDESPLRTTTTGRLGFVLSLGLLFMSSLLTAFSTVIAFVVLVAALLLTLLLGSLATFRSSTIEETIEEVADNLAQARGRPSTYGNGAPPPSAERCTGFRADGERCRNGRSTGDRCGIHQVPVVV